MTSRPDTPSERDWIARLGACSLLGFFVAVSGAQNASAQILGPQTPGTPGAIEGEFRTRPLSRPPERPGMPLRSPDPDLEGTPASRKYGIRRTPNTAAKRQPGSGQTRTGGFAGASPAGGGNPMTLAPAPRDPRAVSGTRFTNTGPASPQQPRASVPYGVAPGLASSPLQQQRRPAREDDPFAPVGIRAGGMVLRPALEVSGGYESNPARASASPKSSPAYKTEVALDAASDWSAHRLDINLRGAFTGYTALSAANRPDGDARIALRLDATRDLAIEAGLTARADTENATSVNLPGGARERTPYFTYGATLGATQRFGYASLNLRGNVDRNEYGDVKTATGTTSQDARNYTTYGVRLRGSYEITPGIAPFLEGSLDRRVHDLAQDTAGYARDSSGTTLRLGSTFELARDLTGEASAGYTIRAYEDARLANMRAPLLEGSLTWAASALTTLNLRAQSEIGETTVAGSSGARSYRATATLTHAFLRNFTASATLGLSKTDYDRVARQENGVNGGLRLEYKFNRLMALRGSYNFEKQTVSTPGENYTSHAFMLGMRFTP